MKEPEMKRDGTDKCPRCGSHIIFVEYAYGDPNHYDGASEYACARAYETDGKECDYKVGRFCGQRLDWKQQEPAYCQGKAHIELLTELNTKECKCVCHQPQMKKEWPIGLDHDTVCCPKMWGSVK